MDWHELLYCCCVALKYKLNDECIHLQHNVSLFFRTVSELWVFFRLCDEHVWLYLHIFFPVPCVCAFVCLCLLYMYRAQEDVGVCKLYLHAVVMGAFSIEVTAVVVDAAVVQRAEAHEAMLQRVVPLLVHVVVPDHILLTGEPLQNNKSKNRQEIKKG